MALMLIAVFLLVTLFAVLSHYMRQISNWIVNMKSQEQAEIKDIQQQIRDLRAMLRDISMTDEFAKYAKTERKINRLNQELKTISKSRSELFMKVEVSLNAFFCILQGICILGLILTFRRTPLLHIPEEWVWPAGSLVSFPTGITGAVGITWWMLCCNRAVSKTVTFFQT